jgi:hypothetical protein
MSKIEEIERKISKLPPGAISELDLYLDTLLKKVKQAESKDGKLKQDWGGALKEWKKDFTSLELQKKALEWRKG